jgi:multimeric flavodoxin WrbA
MKIAIITSSPNSDGLTAACGARAEQAAMTADTELLSVNLNNLKIGKCNACGDGWGTCLEEHYCQIQDDFQGLHQKLKETDMFFVVTPVYWGEMSESAKAFFDRLRRCEALNGEKSLFYNKPVVAVAAAGGSGNGTISCLESMERLFKHMHASIFDLITITRKSRDYKLDTIQASVAAMIRSMKGESL